MLIVHFPDPDSTDAVEYTLKPESLPSDEAEMIEGAGDGAWETYHEWWALLDKRHRKAMRAGLWVCLRRTDPTLRMEDVQPTVGQLTWRYDDEYLSLLWSRFIEDPEQNTDQETRDAYLLMLKNAGWKGKPDARVVADPLETPNGSPEKPTPTDPGESSTGGGLPTSST
jgi:hypothetical protein